MPPIDDMDDLDEEVDDEAEDEADEYSSGPAGILEAAGFSAEQSEALVEAMRACYDEEEEGEPAAPKLPKRSKGGGVDLAIVFGGGKGRRKR